MELEDILKGKYKWLTIPTIVWVALWIILSIIKPDFLNVRKKINKDNCEKEQIFKTTHIQGIISKKFSDERKNKYFNYTQEKNTYVSYHALLKDEEYDFLKVGDSIFKEKGSLELKVGRLGIYTTFQVNLNCREALLNQNINK